MKKLCFYYKKCKVTCISAQYFVFSRKKLNLKKGLVFKKNKMKKINTKKWSMNF